LKGGGAGGPDLDGFIPAENVVDTSRLPAQRVLQNRVARRTHFSVAMLNIGEGPIRHGDHLHEIYPAGVAQRDTPAGDVASEPLQVFIHGSTLCSKPLVETPTHGFRCARVETHTYNYIHVTKALPAGTGYFLVVSGAFLTGACDVS